MGSITTKRLAWIGGVTLLFLHLDFWRERGTELYFGWLPEELAWRVGWMFLAFCYLVWFCRSVWVEDEG